MNKKLLITFAMISAAALAACSDKSHTSSWEDEEGSVSRESFRSSSSLSTRLDINYADTVNIGESSVLQFEYAKKSGDSAKAKLTCNKDNICIDKSSKNVSLFIGEYPAGTRFSISAATKHMAKDSIFVHNEFGEILKAMKPLSMDGGSTYTNYMLPGTEEQETNLFVTFDPGFFYLNLKADFDSISTLDLLVNVDSAYYNYIGDTTEMTVGLNDTIRGISIIGKSKEEVNIKFASATGYSITANAVGTWISEYKLFEEDNQIVYKKMATSSQKYGGIDSLGQQLLLPYDSTNWTINIKPLNIENYMSGPFATFEAIINSRALGKGEYLAYPDSLSRPGDIDTVIRDNNQAAKYYLRQEQYIWIANMKKGDSILISQNMKGYSANKDKVIEVLNKKGEVLATINEYNNKFKAKSDGPVYVHYLSACEIDNLQCGNLDGDNVEEKLYFITSISYYGSITSIGFYDAKDGVIDTKDYNPGDVITLKALPIRVLPSTASTNVKWFIPCEDVENIFTIQSRNCDDGLNEQEISSTKLKINEDTHGLSARLIAESIADPTKRDTLTISVN